MVFKYIFKNTKNHVLNNWTRTGAWRITLYIIALRTHCSRSMCLRSAHVTTRTYYYYYYCTGMPSLVTTVAGQFLSLGTWIYYITHIIINSVFLKFILRVLRVQHRDLINIIIIRIIIYMNNILFIVWTLGGNNIRTFGGEERTRILTTETIRIIYIYRR